MDQRLRDDIARYAQACHEEELDLLRALARIPAPTRHEERRAAFVADWLRAHGATDVRIDEATNVVCLLTHPSTEPHHALDLVTFSAHTDVVFPDRDELPLTETEDRLYAPGVGDDTANLVGLMMATAYLLERTELLPRNLGILVVANSCEEGLGNCDGIRAICGAYADRIRSLVSFDTYLPRLIDIPVGSERYRVTVLTQGGHSYHDFGRPSAIASLCAFVTEYYGWVSEEGHLMAAGAPVTLNVGTIEGGTTVNAIAAEASALVEYRSTSNAALVEMRGRLERLVEAHRSAGVGIELELLGRRPGMGPIDEEAFARLTDRNAAIIRGVMGTEAVHVSSSTDANIPLSLGIPANTIGTVEGALLHTRDEWIDKASLVDGLRVILEVMLSSW